MPEQAGKPVGKAEVRQVADLLQRAYPTITAHKEAEGVFTDSPLESLVRTILSQHTTDVNRDRAFTALRAAYQDWVQVIHAPLEELIATIRMTNHAPTKALRIQEMLRAINEERGVVSLDFLRQWPTERVLTYLTHIKGVGPKSAAIVALFALHRPVMPVDTHVYRVAQRLGWVGAKTTVARAHAVLQALIPEALILPLHVGLWAHGHLTCRPKPRCGQCAIYRCCQYPAKTAPEPPVEEAIAITAGQFRPAA